jgi:ATP-binding cassette, subfamily C, bacterial LapB
MKNKTMNSLFRNGLPGVIDLSSRLAGQRALPARLQQIDAELDSDSLVGDAFTFFVRAWELAGLQSKPLHLHNPTPANLPFVVFVADKGWLTIQSRDHDESWLGVDAAGRPARLPTLSDTQCIALPPPTTQETQRPTSLSLVRSALLQRRQVFMDAILATAIVSALSLATSLYAMQVYDRVIPSHGYQTLLVLTVGIALSILLELVLKQTRSVIVDRVSNDTDHELSAWFFNRMMGVRMESRPTAVGTLASQVKGFEMVRGVLTSASLFVLADVPFALLFILVIAIIGGSLALVPLIALPIALITGLMFQRAIQAHTRKNLVASNRKAGLLVEAVDGAEMLKATSGEWNMQSRWNRLIAEVAEAEQGTRTRTSLSQNLTMALQQISYVGMIALGAMYVADNKMTMGALIACSIISNRALAPVVQLPGTMVQWALARAALDGLDQIVRLPNEADDAHKALVPHLVDPSLRFERIRFAYGAVNRVVLEVERLEIRAGERVGLVGPIGSGKSTLLKLASGLYRPNEGRVFLGGIDMASLAPTVVRETVGYLPQDVRLFSGTLRENLLLGLPDPGEDAILAAATRTGLIDLISAQSAGLALELTEGGRGVSGGQKQLIGLTRMLLAKPKIWLLDEPTGAMDAASETKVLALLSALANEGVTMLITTHKTALLPVLERLLVLQGGRPQFDGPRDAVLAKLSHRPQVVPQENA